MMSAREVDHRPELACEHVEWNSEKRPTFAVFDVAEALVKIDDGPPCVTLPRVCSTIKDKGLRARA